jgi:hypothetical protein
LWPGAGVEVFGFGPSATRPICRIRRWTRLRLIRQPSARSLAVIRREPKNGHSRNSSSNRRRIASSSSLAIRAGR